MDHTKKSALESKIVQIVRNLQTEPTSWVDLAQIGASLAAVGIQYKKYGFEKLRPFLSEFQSVLEFDYSVDGDKPPVYYARPRNKRGIEYHHNTIGETGAQEFSSKREEVCKYPSSDAWLFRWAILPNERIERLAHLALEEKWHYGNTQSESTEKYPILRNYLGYTFKKLCSENKISFATDRERKEEYAAFNTGLVDRKYEYIYALFKQNTKGYGPYWYLVDFVVAGEDVGKTLVSLFNPMPRKADYFHGKIENILYDTASGGLSCDYMHILTERTSRLPLALIEENCPTELLLIDGMDIRTMYERSNTDEKKKEYFYKLGERIKSTPKVLNRLKNRLEDAVNLALKRVEWNYKTAIPMYFPSKETMSLLLPLALADEDEIDLALVVERQQSGAYQGQTVLPLDIAYSNSRLVTRLDSNWLQVDRITAEPDTADDE